MFLSYWKFSHFHNFNFFVFKGGNIVHHFASTLQQWITDLGCQTIPETSQILSRFHSLTNEHLQYRKELECSSPQIIPRLYGERYERNSRMCIRGITAGNMSLSNTLAALYESIIQNLTTMMPYKLLQEHRIDCIVTTGGTLTNNMYLQQCVVECYGGISLRCSNECDAADGAAIFFN